MCLPADGDGSFLLPGRERGGSVDSTWRSQAHLVKTACVWWRLLAGRIHHAGQLTQQSHDEADAYGDEEPKDNGSSCRGVFRVSGEPCHETIG